MKTFKVIIILVISFLGLEDIHAQFNGGFGDGFSVENCTKTLTNEEPVPIFFGGNGDGFAVVTCTKTLTNEVPIPIFFGGNGDGFSVVTCTKTLTNEQPVTIFFGGNGDGFSVVTCTKTLTNEEPITIFFGGNGDGFSSEIVSTNLLLDDLTIYNGGFGDGFSVSQKSLILLEQVRSDIIAFLQGPLLNATDSGLMNDMLRENNLLPTTSPYQDAVTIDESILSVTGNNAIVDWVFVELRNSLDNTKIIASKSALLQRDGSIVDLDGVSSLAIETPPDDYYIVVKHRNHLSIMTTTPISLTGTTTSVNFTDAGNQITFGDNAQTTFGMPSGVVAMWAGNVNGDTLIQYSGTDPDTPAILSAVLNDPGNFLGFPTYEIAGYNNNDINMDGVTQYSGTNPDTPFILQNVLADPGNFLNFSTYQILEQLPEN